MVFPSTSRKNGREKADINASFNYLFLGKQGSIGCETSFLDIARTRLLPTKPGGYKINANRTTKQKVIQPGVSLSGVSVEILYQKMKYILSFEGKIAIFSLDPFHELDSDIMVKLIRTASLLL